MLGALKLQVPGYKSNLPHANKIYLGLMKYFKRQEACYNYGPFGISIIEGEGLVKRHERLTC
jgi:hypothetical protein